MRERRRRGRGLLLAGGLLVLGGLALALASLPFGSHVFLPDARPEDRDGHAYDVPLDPLSPWPKFRANALQNGRSPLRTRVSPSLRPWSFQTGKSVFSSPVVDGRGHVYVGSADQVFYAIGPDGRLLWSYETGGVIDSAALLDDRGRVYFGSGDAYVHALDRNSGELVWKFRADPVEAVEARYGVESYNVDWFEGNIGMLEDGTLVAPNDNFLVYLIDRDSGRARGELLGNELMWSLPAVNVSTGRLFLGSQFVALRNLFAFDAGSGERVWSSGGWGSNAASPLLTSRASDAAVIVGGYDGYVRAFAQQSGRQLWRRGLRDHIYASPAQLSDGTLIQPSTDGSIYALEPSSGEVLWAYDTLAPIRSSPAVDGEDRIYVGGGDGRLLALEPDGRLRWSYRCIEAGRDDLNASPALGPHGVTIAGQDGGIFHVPYDYPLTEAGRSDPRSGHGPGEALPADGVFLVYSQAFGGLLPEPPEQIRANQPLAFELFVRRGGDTIEAAIDREGLSVSVTGAPTMTSELAADGQFLVLTPREAWTAAEGATIRVRIAGHYRTGLWRFGLKSFGGQRGGAIDQTFEFRVAPRSGGAPPYRIPSAHDPRGSVFELSRFAAPQPSMLPSWNQIGFDSLHYLAGAVEGTPERALLWVVAGRRQAGRTVVDPSLELRFPLVMEHDRGLLTFHNYEGFKIDFVGAWDMPFGLYRASTRADPGTGAILEPAELVAVALAGELEYYGRFLQLMGLAELRSGRMPVFGGLEVALQPEGQAAARADVGEVRFSREADLATARVAGGSLRRSQHAFGLLLVDAETGRPLPLYYTRHTVVSANERSEVTAVQVRLRPADATRPLRAFYMVDTYPAARGEL